MQFSIKTLLALLPYFIQVNTQALDSGIITRYWDYCKSSYAWPGKANLLVGSNLVQIYNINNNLILDPNAASGYDGGTVY